MRLWIARAASLLLVIALCGHLKALDPRKSVTQYGINNWSSENGFPQASIEALAQTRDGYLWFGTQEGLARFDGVRFTVLNQRTTPAIPNKRVTALLAARDGSLWIATYFGGLSRLHDG